MATIKLAAVPLWKVNRRRPHAGELKTGPGWPGFLLRQQDDIDRGQRGRPARRLSAVAVARPALLH